MNPGKFWDLGTLSDEQVLKGLSGLLLIERRALARVIAHLVEVESRRLHLRAACSSMFDYCLRRLGLTEGEAFRRVTAARLARKFPVIFELVEREVLHLTAICQLRDHLTPENHEELLREACHKSKRQVEELLARRFPKADVPCSIRKLPAPRSEAPSAASSALIPVPEAERSGPVVPAAGVAATVSELPPQSATAQQRIEPLSAERYRIQLCGGPELKRKLEEARALMSHSNPSGDLATVVERALTALIAELERERFAKTSRPARTQPPTRRTKGRYVAAVTRREVFSRDGGQCTFVNEDGVRCESRSFLQLHHEHAYARGGGPGVDNLRLLCAAQRRPQPPARRARLRARTRRAQRRKEEPVRLLRD